jgi:uncharacterized protein (TIGR02647 family)
MSYTPENLAELNVLMLYDLSTNLEGIKVHKTAEASVIAAAHRLFDKGIITQTDGGYLTSLGRDAAEHAQSLFTILDAHNNEHTGK